MKNNKAFTLIELLAIIIILGIIAVITIPQINKTIENSKKETIKDSAHGYKNAIQQFYLTESQKDNEFDLEGSYEIDDKSIKQGNNTYDISLNGKTPVSGDIDIVNGEITNGCINYGTYSVLIEDGNVKDTVKGECYKTTYFTLEDNKESTTSENATNKLPSPDPSWNIYVKEKEYLSSYSYGIYLIENNQAYTYTENAYYTYEECEEVKNTLIELEDDSSDIECRKTNNKLKKYEICGIKSGKEFCLKTGFNDYNYNEEIINSTFNDCEVINSSNFTYIYTCNETTYGLFNVKHEYDRILSNGIGIETPTHLNICMATRGSVNSPEDNAYCEIHYGKK